jgi:hypothetical protein
MSGTRAGLPHALQLAEQTLESERMLRLARPLQCEAATIASVTTLARMDVGALDLSPTVRGQPLAGAG